MFDEPWPSTLPPTAVSGLLAASPAFAADGVSFSTPGNSAKVSSPVHVEMAVVGLEVRPAGKQTAMELARVPVPVLLLCRAACSSSRGGVTVNGLEVMPAGEVDCVHTATPTTRDPALLGGR